MRIVHDSTVRLHRGWQTIIRVENEQEVETALVIRHDATVSRIISSSMENVEAAVARETILDRREFINGEIANIIEEGLINWISRNKSTDYKRLRWSNNVMIGFTSEEEAQKYDEENSRTPDENYKRKKRIMLG